MMPFCSLVKNVLSVIILPSQYDLERSLQSVPRYILDVFDTLQQLVLVDHVWSMIQ